MWFSKKSNEQLEKVRDKLKELSEVQSFSSKTQWVEMLAEAGEPLSKIKSQDLKVSRLKRKTADVQLEEIQTLYTKILFDLLNADDEKNIKTYLNPLLLRIDQFLLEIK